MTVERQTCIDELAKILQNDLGSSAVQVASYIRSDWQGASPVVGLFGGGTQWVKDTVGRLIGVHDIFIYLFVLYADAKATVLTEQVAQQTLSQLGIQIAQSLTVHNRRRDLWASIEFVEPSEVDVITMKEGYFVEVFPIRIRSV